MATVHPSRAGLVPGAVKIIPSNRLPSREEILKQQLLERRQQKHGVDSIPSITQTPASPPNRTRTVDEEATSRAGDTHRGTPWVRDYPSNNEDELGVAGPSRGPQPQHAQDRDRAHRRSLESSPRRPEGSRNGHVEAQSSQPPYSQDVRTSRQGRSYDNSPHHFTNERAAQIPSLTPQTWRPPSWTGPPRHFFSPADLERYVDSLLE